MGLFSALVKIAVDVVALPVDIAKDVITLGGTASEQDKPYTAQRLDQIKRDAEDADD